MFFGHSEEVGTFSALYDALQNSAIAGAVASPALSVLFAVALLASGQNSTITGTLTGQVVMEGFIHMKIPTWARRLITRGLSVVPVLLCTLYFGGNEQALDNLLIYSQVFLSIALPVSMIPLVYFTSSKKSWAKSSRTLCGSLLWLDLRHRINSPQHSLDHRNNVMVF